MDLIHIKEFLISKQHYIIGISLVIFGLATWIRGWHALAGGLETSTAQFYLFGIFEIVLPVTQIKIIYPLIFLILIIIGTVLIVKNKIIK